LKVIYHAIARNTKVITRKSHLYFINHKENVKLPSPTLARTSGSCQQNAYASAEAMAPLLKSNSFME